MNKINKLIEEKCSNSVKYEKLEDIVDILDKKRKPIAKGLRECGKYPYYGANGVQDYVEDFIFDGTFLLVGEDGSVINKDNSPVLNWATGKIWVNNHAHVLKEKNDKVLLRYIYYYMQTLDIYDLVKGMPPKFNQQNLRNLRIAVPPIEIQKEIVYILDKFGELELALEEELNFRKIQYKFLSNKLFETCAYKNKKQKIADIIISLTTGLNPRQNFKLNMEGCNRPYITGKDVFNHQINVTDKTDYISDKDVELINKRAKLCDDIILFASTGTGTVGRMAYIEEYNNDWNVSETLFVLNTNKQIVNTKYLMYCLESEYSIKQYKDKISKGSVPHLKIKDLLNVEIPIPTLEKQEKIVEILEKFDVFTSNVIEGLPAEIELRKKQYEYYRNKLLSFKEVIN